MTWVVENMDSLLTIVTAVLMGVVWVMSKMGWIQRERANELTSVIEDCNGSIAAFLSGLDLKKMSVEDIAKAAQRAVKGTVRQRMAKAARSVVLAVADGAAEVDPDPKKLPRSPLRRFGGLIRSRLFGG